MKKSNQELITDLLSQLKRLPHRNSAELDALKRKTEMVIRNVFSETSKYLTDLNRIRFSPQVYPTSEEAKNTRWISGTQEFRNMLNTMAEELSLFGDDSPKQEAIHEKENTEKGIVNSKKAKVFIVHGRDDVIKNKVARFLEKLNITPIILHEQPNAGRTIIEKFEGEAADVDFAIVLLTADDQGMLLNSEDGLQARARQNVIFELGYFIGTLKRTKVVALREDGVELPSDYAGIIYIDLDEKDTWRLQIAAEIKHAGIDIDLNKVV